ncbi:hypothetical protein NI17_024030 (plasmid) [Thermobifida halotolerans]|uniref:HTH cro/C1-type domain-containing protein n=1 Tax=Thermobifida halotolerans TaxID=483545 RepID=A0AA97M2F4_9ACTN|nr:hypothetical protein [Thermobifida halotolerans]UOE22284.1 hypothetical protein NI17_024030 [Thermobifida halotolerans]
MSDNTHASSEAHHLRRLLEEVRSKQQALSHLRQRREDAVAQLVTPGLDRIEWEELAGLVRELDRQIDEAEQEISGLRKEEQTLKSRLPPPPLGRPATSPRVDPLAPRSEHWEADKAALPDTVPVQYHTSEKASLLSSASNIAAPVVQDAEGYDLIPDPLEARNSAEFVTALEKLRLWAGSPSFRTMARRSGRSASWLCGALKQQEKLPKYELLMAFLSGCGITDKETVQRWVTAWRRLSISSTVTAADPPFSSAANPVR